ncbi:alpha-amylase family glycosyl hydrolase [Neptunitalea lumnitzerae]|uniref:Alpha-amylase n=1 Tax=Neptunitalea lumnitzerae TaxID=2965509 RepID=A0ABQ5MGK1_9FLAO|nr:alpha-amylase family glycosyl hydrolase [Neptunitalea sp. Y10]GLB48548.1 alpha-amylase [Neptunitalea sp. Y10]
MKKIVLSLVMLAFLASCNENAKPKETKTTEETEVLAPISDSVLETATIYEANIRQYSEEGTFDAFTKDIPALKEMGIDIIWVMPIYPISSTKSKGSLGSYYAITDYTKVNPEFGTLEDFQELVKTAHDNGIYVILDWVANHTGWDHVWITEHPDYYTQDKDGNIVDPLNPETGESWGWTDVADLNYDNKAMRKEMTEDMAYWIKEQHIDGFRCDVADNVPTDFWEEAIPALRAEKDIFMLAESAKAELVPAGFDMLYNWPGLHTMNDIAKGEKTADAWNALKAEQDSTYAKGTMFMNFITNHDENSWNGTVFERYGDGVETFAALEYMTPGMPLIYSGQEYDMNKALLFFEKDTINKTKGKFYPIYEKLNKLKATHPALNGGKNAAAYEVLPTTADAKVLAFKRSKEGDEVYYIANLTAAPVTAKVDLEGNFTEYMSGKPIQMGATALELKPWQYMILVK